MPRRLLLLVALLALDGWGAAVAQSLRGSPASLDRQNRQARAHNFSFLNRPADVQRFVSAGYLVPVRGNADYELAAVSFPYARPEVRTFVERLAGQYRAACGEKLVVTSLVRPNSHQPSNASDRSVHPTGMAVDLRVSNNARCVRWLESTLLHLEGENVIEATRERRPPHFHIAVFPRPYIQYATGRGGAASGRQVAAAEAARSPAAEVAEAVAAAAQIYRVRRGDSLWSIARRHGTTVELIQQENGLPSSRVLAGQVLRIPVLESASR